MAEMTPPHERGKRGVALGHLSHALLPRQGSLFTVDQLLDDPLDQDGGGALAVTTLWDMTDALARLIKALGTTETYQQAGYLNADVGGILFGHAASAHGARQARQRLITLSLGNRCAIGGRRGG
jgi:hypothetical protein